MRIALMFLVLSVSAFAGGKTKDGYDCSNVCHKKSVKPCGDSCIQKSFHCGKVKGVDHWGSCTEAELVKPDR